MTKNKPAPPPAKKAAGKQQPPQESTQQKAPQQDRFSILSGKIGGAQRILLYGAGGIGKSTLASLAPEPVFIDIESSTRELDVPRVEGIEDYSDVRACLQSTALDAFETIVIDSGTKAEEWSLAHTLKTVMHEKGNRVNSIEGYGFGKGYQHVFDTFMLLLADLDSQVRRGRNVILIAHDCIADVPNPVGDDFIRFEPHMQAPRSGKASIRNRVIQWADHVLFIGYDVMAKDGKAIGGGTRTIYTTELPDHIAKSRRVSTTVQFEGPEDGSIWNSIIGGES